MYLDFFSDVFCAYNCVSIAFQGPNFRCFGVIQNVSAKEKNGQIKF